MGAGKQVKCDGESRVQNGVLSGSGGESGCQSKAMGRPAAGTGKEQVLPSSLQRLKHSLVDTVLLTP